MILIKHITCSKIVDHKTQYKQNSNFVDINNKLQMRYFYV